MEDFFKDQIFLHINPLDTLIGALQVVENIREKIEKDLQDKCIKQNEFNPFAADTHKPSIRETFECQTNALGEASMNNGMTTEWNEYGPQLKQHLNAWKQCDNVDNGLEKHLYVYTNRN